MSIAATNTMLASATASLACYLWMVVIRKMRPDPTMLCNGMLAGLVAITAPCAFVSSGAACFIGIVSGVLVVESVFFFDRVAKVDDPVGAISVHGVNGAWGTLAVGLFADGTYGDGWNGVSGTVTGLFYGGGVGQLGAQILGLVSASIYLVIISIFVFGVVGRLGGLRVSQAIEIEGLDIPEMGIPGYMGVVLDKASETPIPKDHAGNPTVTPHPLTVK